MRRRVLAHACGGVLLLVSHVAGNAQFTCTTNNGTITITKYTGPGGAVVIPDSINGLPVTSIGRLAFSWWTSLTSLTIPDSVTSIGDHAFYGCTNLASVIIGSSVATVEEGAFYYCTSLTSVIIPSSVTSIGSYAFYGCINLTRVTIGNSVTSIGDYALWACTSMTAIEVDALNPVYSSLDGVLFNKNRTTLLQCPGGKTGAYVIPDSVTTIEVYAFNECYGLTHVVIPNSVTSIRGRAFYSCTRLRSVSIGDGVTSIEIGAFSGCTGLTGAVVPASVTSIGPLVFSYCASLTAIEVDPLNPVYSSFGGVLFDKDRTTLLQYPGGGAGLYIIPESVTSIGQGAFSACTGLTSLAIPASVTSIGDGAFYGCTGLTSVIIGSGVTSLSRDVQLDTCTSLTGVYFQGNAPSTAGGVFGGNWSVAVYYLLGTTGWGTTFSGRPTALWAEPLILEGSVGMQSGALGFTIAWAPDVPVVVEGSPTLPNPTWSSVSTNFLTGGLSRFRDSELAAHSARFYRLRSP